MIARTSSISDYAYAHYELKHWAKKYDLVLNQCSVVEELIIRLAGIPESIPIHSCSHGPNFHYKNYFVIGAVFAKQDLKVNNNLYQQMANNLERYAPNIQLAKPLKKHLYLLDLFADTDEVTLIFQVDSEELIRRLLPIMDECLQVREDLLRRYQSQSYTSTQLADNINHSLQPLSQTHLGINDSNIGNFFEKILGKLFDTKITYSKNPPRVHFRDNIPKTYFKIPKKALSPALTYFNKLHINSAHEEISLRPEITDKTLLSVDNRALCAPTFTTRIQHSFFNHSADLKGYEFKLSPELSDALNKLDKLFSPEFKFRLEEAVGFGKYLQVAYEELKEFAHSHALESVQDRFNFFILVEVCYQLALDISQELTQISACEHDLLAIRTHLQALSEMLNVDELFSKINSQFALKAWCLKNEAIHNLFHSMPVSMLEKRLNMLLVEKLFSLCRLLATDFSDSEATRRLLVNIKDLTYHIDYRLENIRISLYLNSKALYKLPTNVQNNLFAPNSKNKIKQIRSTCLSVNDLVRDIKLTLESHCSAPRLL